MTVNNRYTLTSSILILVLCLAIVYALFHTSAKNIGFCKTFVIPDGEIINSNSLNTDITFSQNYIRHYFKFQVEELELHWLKIIKHYVPVPLESGYGSHKIALLAASILTAQDGGPAMEMGCGYYSTILLHQILVNEQKRYLLSTDTDREWLSKFEANFSSPTHQFRHISRTSDWDNVGIDRPRWSIVFIDHKPGERRVVDMIRLANVSDVVIVHDSETSSYNYEQGLSLYPYKYRYNYLSTNTDVISKSNGTLFQHIRHLLELTITMKIPKA
jgi:hypothetical protein